MSSGERPVGAAKGKQTNSKALCQPPPLQRGNANKQISTFGSPPPPRGMIWKGTQEQLWVFENRLTSPPPPQ